MNASELNPADPYSLFRVGEAWRNRPGLTTVVITYVVVALLFVLGSLGGQVLMGMGILLGTLFTIVGLSAAGLQFMDQAAGRAVSPVLTAFISSPMVILRSLGLMLILAVVFFGYLAVAAIILFVCKVPGLGALVYVIALPVLTFLGALVFLGLTVSSLISGAALWDGRSLSAALLQGWAVATQRPMQAFLNIVMLFLVVSLVALVISGLVFAGFGVVGGLTAAILGSDMASGMSNLMGSVMGGGLGGRGSGSAMIYSGLIGGALVFAVVEALFTAIFALGSSLTYLKTTEGLDITAAQSAMDSAIAKTKEKAQQAATEAKRRAQEVQVAAQQRADQARAAQQEHNESPIKPALACPKCNDTVVVGEAFCGSCGFKLI